MSTATKEQKEERIHYKLVELGVGTRLLETALGNTVAQALQEVQINGMHDVRVNGVEVSPTERQSRTIQDQDEVMAVPRVRGGRR